MKKLHIPCRRVLAMLIGALTLFTLISPVLAVSEVKIESRDTIALFDYNGSAGWLSLTTPEHYIVGTNDVAYCLQHRKSSPHISHNFDEVELSDFYSTRVLTGLQIILERGYPAETPSYLTATEARYATANAIRFWLSENGDSQQYNFTNRRDRPGSIRAKSGNQAVLDFADELLEYARNQVRLQHSVSFSPANVSMTISGAYFVGTTTISLLNCNGGYALNKSGLPAGTIVTGDTGRNGDVLTIQIPATHGNQNFTLNAAGLDNRVTANIFMYASLSSSIQDVIAVTSGNYHPVGNGSVTMSTPAFGGLQIVKTTQHNNGTMSGFQFRVATQGGALVGTYTSGSGGTISIPNLAAGMYTVEEINLTDDFVPPSPNPVIVEVKSGQTATVSFDNVKKQGIITVQKTNANPTLGNYSLAGAEFTVKNASGTVVDTIKTGSDGRGESELLALGTYMVQETKAPPGFALDKTVYTRTLTGAQGTGAVVYCPEITVAEQPQGGKVTITKRDAETAAAAQGDATLSGAIFNLLDSDGNVVERLHCGNNTSVTSMEIPLGDYIVKEVVPPKGYTLSVKEYPVSIVSANQEVNVELVSTTVTNTVTKGRISIYKHSDQPDPRLEPENPSVLTPMENITFRIWLKAAGSYNAAKATERDTLVTDKNGYATSKLLPYGVYVVEEVEDSSGEHKICEPFEVAITEDGRTYFYSVENPIYTGAVKIVKVDAETGKTIPVPNVEFQVKNTDTGKFIVQEILYPMPLTMDSYLTNADGWLIMPKPLPAGNYELYEIQSPYGYLLADKPVAFKVTSKNQQTVLEVKMPNKPAMGKVTIEKTGEMLVGADEIEGKAFNSYVPRYEVRYQQGAVFEIIARSDIVTPDGTVRAKAGTVVDTLTTKADGRVESKSLYLGDYYAIERKAPFGMALDATEHDFSLVYENQTTAIVSTEVRVSNERQRVKINLSKVCELPENAPEDFNPYVSIVFGLFAREDILSADGDVAIPANGLVEYITLDEDGNATVQTDLPFGSYYIVELQMAAGYAPCETEYDVVFAYDGQYTKVVEIEINNGKPIENFLMRGGLKVIKTFEGRETPIAGVPFTIIGQTIAGTVDTFHVVSDENGEILLENLLIGDYTIQELDSALTAGYVLSPEQTVTVATDEITELTIHNSLMRGDLKIIKTFEGQTVPLAGVKFTVAGVSIAGIPFESALETDENGAIFLEGLPVGDYAILEIGSELTEGYVLSEEQTITVAHERLTELIIQNNIIRGNVKLTKTDKETGATLALAIFDLYGPDGQQQGVYVTDENGELLIEKLPYGYGYKLVENEAPEGYKLSNVEFVFDITEDGAALEFEAENEKAPVPDNPKTGDGSNPILLVAVIVASAAGLVILAVSIIRSKKKGGKA